MITFFCLVRYKWHQISQQAVKTDRSTRKMDRQQPSAFNHLRYHCFKQRMKYKHTHRGYFIKPKSLFHLTWKFKALKLTLCTATFVYLVGCHMERLVGYSFQRLLHLHQLRHQIGLNCQMRKHAIRQAFKSTTATSLPLPFWPRFDTDSFRIGIDTPLFDYHVQQERMLQRPQAF